MNESADGCIAPGRVSCKKKAPTAGELRRRRKVEIENHKEVGFVGTLFGARARPTDKTGAAMTENNVLAQDVGEETIESSSERADVAGDAQAVQEDAAA